MLKGWGPGDPLSLSFRVVLGMPYWLATLLIPVLSSMMLFIAPLIDLSSHFRYFLELFFGFGGLFFCFLNIILSALLHLAHGENYKLLFSYLISVYAGSRLLNQVIE